MGQKVNPVGLRLGINRTWDSRWFADGADYGRMLHEDLKIRKNLKKRLYQASVSRIIIERPHKKCRITIYAARPGVIIGKKGADIEKLRKKVAEMTNSEVHLNIVEVRKPEVDATLVAENIAQQLERRVAFRRAMKRAVQSAQRMGAEGIKITCAGRLGGAEIARTEWYREGRVPLHTLRADIDYGFSEAKTTYGVIGVKVWVYKGDTLGRNDLPAAVEPRAEEERRPRGPRRDGRPAGDRPAAPRGARRPAGSAAAPADGSDKPAEATGADAKSTVKRVRKVAAPAAAADGVKGE